jgi:hypothetical protein
MRLLIFFYTYNFSYDEAAGPPIHYPAIAPDDVSPLQKSAVNWHLPTNG